MSAVTLEVQLANEVLALEFPGDYQTLASKYPFMHVEDDSALWAHASDVDARKDDLTLWKHDLAQFFLTEIRRQSMRYQDILRTINTPGCRAVCIPGLVKLEVLAP